MTDTSHIEACRKLWIEHENQCSKCYFHNHGERWLCNTGAKLYDEYQQAISKTSEAK